MTTFALSPQQELVWLHHQLAPHSTAYNSVLVTDLTGPLDVGALRAAVRTVAANHDAFRLALGTGADGRPVQRLVEHAEAEVELVDHVPGADLVGRFARHVFDLGTAPLARWWLIRYAPGRHRLVHVESHLVHDGRSVGLFLTEMVDTYRRLCAGEAPSLPPSVSYRDYVAHCESREHRQAVAEDLAWWDRTLAGARLGEPVFRGLAHRVGTRRGFAGAQVRRALPPGVAAGLTALARSSGCTLFALVFGLFAELVRRHDGGDEVTVGTALANRPARFERMVGMVVNAVPVRLPLDPGATAGALGVATMVRLFDALDHGAAPLQDIVRVTGRSSGTLDNPLFRTMVSIHDTALPDGDLPGLDVSFTEGVNPAGSRTADVDLVLLPGVRVLGDADPDAITCVWDYSTEFFDEQAITVVAERFERLLSAAADAPAAPVATLGLTGPGDPPAVLTGPPATPLSRGELLDRIGAQPPGGTALVAGRTTLTYGALLADADALAARLAAAGLTGGDVVAALLPRAPSAVVALLACLRGGYVFAPLPVAWTENAVAAAVARLSPAVVLSPGSRLAALRAAGVEAGAVDDGTPPRSQAGPRYPGAAYLIHTSGSTGVPKRVVVPDEALGSAATGVAAFLGLSGADTVLQFAQPAFDVFFEEVLPTLLRGGTVVQPAAAVPDAADLAALVDFRGLTVLNLPTAYATAVLPEMAAVLADRPHRLRTVVVGGERLPADAARAMTAGLPGTELVNAYGITEATITSTMARFDATAPEPEVPLGAPLAGTVLAVLDERGGPTPAGVLGELVIGGPGATASYVDSAAGYVTDVPGLPGRFLRTGDVGVIGRDGAARFIGRTDRRLKLRGHRIEPEEIEVAARRLVGDLDVVVVPVTENGAVTGLTGHVETADRSVVADLNGRLAAELPRHLLVTRWVATPRFPRLANGKVDVAALAAVPLPEAGPAADTGTDPVLETVLACFRRVLRREDIGPDADFFLSGGHSLLVANLITAVRDETGVHLGMGQVFEAPTARATAAAVTESRPQRS